MNDLLVNLETISSLNIPQVSFQSWAKRGIRCWRTVYTRRSSSCCSCHLSGEAGAFDSLGSLLDLVLVAASVCGNYLAGSRFHMNCKQKHTQGFHVEWKDFDRDWVLIFIVIQQGQVVLEIVLCSVLCNRFIYCWGHFGNATLAADALPTNVTSMWV